MPVIPGYFKCECGCSQTFASEDCEGGITEKEAESVGWRKINGTWKCPPCCGNTAALDAIFEKADSCDEEDCNMLCEQGLEAVEEHAAKSLKEYGWYVHFISNDSGCPYNSNAHTHGLAENFDHINLQICIPLDSTIIHGVLSEAVKDIKNGIKFEAGKVYDKLLKGDYPVTFAKVKEGKREVLRIILPDQYKCLDRDNMEPEYRDQWDGAL